MSALTWTLLGLYCALVALWALLTIAVWWHRRRAAPDLAGEGPELDAYELVRLDRHRYGQIEVMLSYLLESGALTRVGEWGGPDSRRLPQNTVYRLAVGSALPSDAHELERRLVAATERAPERSGLDNACRVTDSDVCNRIEARLIDAGLLYDESRRWRISWLGWALFWIGLAWAIGRLRAHGAPGDDATELLFIVSMSVFLAGVVSMPETADEADPTPNGRLAFDRARARHAALDGPVALPDVRLAVALFGATLVDKAGGANLGVRDAYELLSAEAARNVL